MPDHHQAPRHPEAPTAKQQSYIRKLALARGVSFTPPKTKAEASRLINDLKRRRPDSRADQLREKRAIERDMATGRGDNAQVRDREVTGYGSTATWSERA